MKNCVWRRRARIAVYADLESFIILLMIVCLIVFVVGYATGFRATATDEQISLIESANRPNPGLSFWIVMMWLVVAGLTLATLFYFWMLLMLLNATELGRVPIKALARARIWLYVITALNVLEALGVFAGLFAIGVVRGGAADRIAMGVVIYSVIWRACPLIIFYKFVTEIETILLLELPLQLPLSERHLTESGIVDKSTVIKLMSD